MQESLDARLVAAHKIASIVLGSVAMLIAGIVFLGYVTGAPLLKLDIAYRFMNPVTALALLSAGASLLILSLGGRRKAWRGIGLALAAATAAVGGIKLAGYLTGADLQFDNVLFVRQLAEESTLRGKYAHIAPPTAACLTMMGAALLLAYRQRMEKASQLLSLMTLAIAFASALWYLYELKNLGAFINYAPMAFGTTAALAALSIGVLYLRPDAGYMRVIMSESTGGMLMRRLLPTLILIPVSLGYVMEWVRHSGFDGSHHSIPSLIAATTFLTMALVWRLSYILQNADAELRRTKAEIKALLDRDETFRQLAEGTELVFWMVNREATKVLYISPAYEKIWGKTVESLYANAQDWATSVHPDDRKRVFAAFSNLASVGFDEEYRIIRPDGIEKWIAIRGFPIKDASGMTYRIAGVAHDVTQRKLDELKMIESKEEYRLRNEELHKMLKITTGREERMAELKLENKRLKDENDALKSGK